jgi:hypothetical protein
MMSMGSLVDVFLLTNVTQFEKLKLSVLCLSIIGFLRETVWRPPCNQLPFAMINASSGGDGMPSPPERVKAVEPATTEAADHCFPEKNPSGSEELEKLGVAENKAASTGNNEITLHGSKDPLSTVPEGNADREIQDVEMSEPVEAERPEHKMMEMMMCHWQQVMTT